MVKIFLVFLAMGVVAAIAFAITMNRLRRMKATYDMYAVRDKFVLLVANGVLNEDSPVFKHHYKRTNMLLQFAPNIGIDQAYKAFLFQTSNRKIDLKDAMEKAKEETDLILKSKELENPEISKAVEDYYSACMEMVLSHSSVTRLYYYAIKHKVFNISVLRKAPIGVQKAMTVIKISDDEREMLFERRNFAECA
ncbi:hypothetical protein [Pseudomonas nicosulfuronedens]